MRALWLAAAIAIGSAAATLVPSIGFATEQSGAVDREALFWESIKGSKDPEDFRAYIKQFPQGTFAALANNRLRTLGQGGRTDGEKKAQHRTGHKPGTSSSSKGDNRPTASAAAYFRDGFNALQANRTQEAIDKFTAGLAIKPDAQAEFYLGEAYRTRSEYAAATAHYNKAIVIEPDNPVNTRSRQRLAELAGAERSKFEATLQGRWREYNPGADLGKIVLDCSGYFQFSSHDGLHLKMVNPRNTSDVRERT